MIPFPTVPPTTSPFSVFSVLPCLMPGNFTCQGRSSSNERVNHNCPASNILLCLRKYNFTCQSRSSHSERVMCSQINVQEWQVYLLCLYLGAKYLQIALTEVKAILWYNCSTLTLPYWSFSSHIEVKII